MKRPVANIVGWVQSSDGTSVVARVLLGALALALATRLSVPFWPVPVTAQTLAVLVLGALLGPREGVASVLAFLGAGVAGLPVFVAGGGPAYLFGPTGGYLVGFIPAAWLAGTLARAGWGRRLSTSLAAMALADAVLFACGLAWLATVLPGDQLLAKGLLPFLPGEAMKVTLAAMTLRRVG